MKELIGAVRQAYNNSNPYAALALALTLPDIAGDYQYPGKSSSKRYIDWFDYYVKPKHYVPSLGHKDNHEFLSGEDCYALRCSLLHNGTDSIINQNKRKVLHEFRFNDVLYNYLHCCTSTEQGNRFLYLNVRTFCEDICSSVEEWLEENKQNEEIQNRINNMFKIEIT